MKLVVLGSGTATPHPARSSAGFWLAIESGTMMLDFGASALHRLAQERLDWPNLDAVWISHFHLDHCLGLAAYLFATRHAAETSARAKPLRIYGSTGIRQLLGNFDQTANNKLLDQPFPVEIFEVENLTRFKPLTGVEATVLKTPHTSDSFAIRLENEKGTAVAYTSDTGFGKEIAAFSRDVDLLIIESSFFKNKTTEIHLELAEAMYLIQKAKPKQALLTHLYADWDDVDFKNEVERFGPPCEVIEAFDGLTIDLPA